ncbi:peptidase M48 [Hyphomicrobium methylovorum]|uniref:M48 family metallopeptidase n=1 Tax=Hyphomicrobium methylovorum TaxID=84 RepID=UPI0015E7E12A|nr:M48 family metallopeptidase [Hyphomicrobium methylovorum]MBA2127522.1 peptidase M48 [Hyphomicrobium methylovorum]
MQANSGTGARSPSYCRYTRPGNNPVDGTASLGLTGVEIDFGTGKPRTLWRYDGLKALEPLRANTIDVLLSSRDEPGATLFVQGRAFAASLREHAPHLSARATRWRRARLWLLLIASIVGIVTATMVTGWSPLRFYAGMLPESWRARLGDAARDSMTEGYSQCVDANGTAALARLSERLSKAAPEGVTFDIRVYDWPLMNAFAVPGAKIILTKGLLDKSDSPDEIAGVLAHEMGHAIAMDPEVGMLRSVGLAAGLEVMLGGTGGGLANIGVMLAQLGYSRSAEHEADVEALVLLKNAGISPKGLGSFFARVTKMESDDHSSGPSGWTWLQTHPPAKERAKLVRAQLDYPSTPALDFQSWNELKEICKTTAKSTATKHGDG